MSEELKDTKFEEEISPDQLKLLHKMSAKVVQLRMTVPAILFMESMRPLNYVGSQVMVFFAPLVQIVFTSPEWDQMQKVLEKRESLGYIIELIEEKESEYLINAKIEKDNARAKWAESNTSMKQRFMRLFRKSSDKQD